MQHRIVRALLFGALILCACDAKRPRAYITPSVHFNKASVPMGTPVDITYVFTTSQGFDGLKKDLIVFVHFIDPSGKIRFVDDHMPPIRTNQWKAGDEYSYTRTLFVPENIPPGQYVVELGLYTPSGKGERFALNATRLSERSYDVGHFAVGRQDPAGEGDFVLGWFDLEREPGNPWEHWRWTGADATLRIKNPKADAILYLKADTDRSRFADPQEVSVRVGDREVDRFRMESNDPIVRRVELKASELGSTETLDLKLHVDQTFMPGGADTRALGIRVYCFYLGKEKG